MDSILSDIYYNVSKGYKSIDQLYKQAKLKNPNLKKNDVKKWLEKQPTYSIHKYARRKYTRNKVIVSAIDEQWQADLVDVHNLSKFNDGYRYILTCIDLFSKYAWAIALKSKQSAEIIAAF